MSRVFGLKYASPFVDLHAWILDLGIGFEGTSIVQVSASIIVITHLYDSVGPFIKGNI